MTSREASAQMIDYLDSMAHLLQIDAYQSITGENPDWDKFDYCMFKADALDRSAAYFRSIDPDLPPRRNRPHPSSHFEAGADARKKVDNRKQKS